MPKALRDSPAHVAGSARQYPGEGGKVWYDEGLLVGYRWNDTKAVEPLFAFGHGLGYTRFRYTALQATLTEGADGPSAALSLQVTNVGDRAGAEIVQAYVRPVKPPVMRPDKELKAFAKVMLAPGETKGVTTRWCSANATEQKASTNFTGSDAAGNRITFTGATVRLLAT